MQENLFATNQRTFDAIIIGGGPAGINCALELKYCGVECLLVNNDEQLGGQLLQIGEELMNVAGRSFKNGPAMAKRMHRQVQPLNTPSNPSNPNASKIKLLLGRSVDSINAKEMTVSIGEDVYKTRTMLLCTGYRLKKLGLPGISKFQQDVLYRDDTPVSDYAGSRVAVLGGGDNALMKALALAEAADQIFLLNRSKRWQARREFLEKAQSNHRIEIIENAELESLSGASKLNGARLIDKATSRIRNLSIEKIFVKIGYTPNTEPFRGQIELDGSGHVLVDKHNACSSEGIYAAGDIVASGCPRIATACGGGAMAAQSMMIFLGKRLS